MKTSEAPLRPTHDTNTVLFVMMVALCAWFIHAPTAQAEEEDEGRHEEPTPKERFATCKDALRDAKRAKDLEQVEAVLDEACTLFADAAGDERLQKDILRLVGTADKGTRGCEVEVLMLRCLGEIGDPRGARYIKRHLVQRDKEACTPTLEAAVQAAAEVPERSLVVPLLKIVEDSETLGIVEDAVAALGHYGALERMRVRILETLVDEARKVKPGGRPRMRGSQEKLNDGSSPYGRESGPGARWTALSASVPGALRQLTGQEVRGMGEWIDVVQARKGNYSDLFADR